MEKIISKDRCRFLNDDYILVHHFHHASTLEMLQNSESGLFQGWGYVSTDSFSSIQSQPATLFFSQSRVSCQTPLSFRCHLNSWLQPLHFQQNPLARSFCFMIASQCRAPYIVTTTSVWAPGKVSFILEGPNLSCLFPWWSSSWRKSLFLCSKTDLILFHILSLLIFSDDTLDPSGSVFWESLEKSGGNDRVEVVLNAAMVSV